MLNKIIQSDELRKRRLVDLYEEGILELGDEIPYIYKEEKYISPEEKNGFINQEFSTKGLDMKWQTIGVESIDCEKCLKLIAKEPVFDFGLGGARGCVYGIGELHNICRLFATGDGALQGRSITIEDVNKLLDMVVDKKEKKIYQKGYKEKIKKNVFFLRKYFFDKKFYTPESYLEGKKVKGKIIETFYWYNIDLIIGKEKERDIINRKVSYFLASSGVIVYRSGNVRFGLGNVSNGFAATGGSNLFYSDGNCNVFRFAVRPILYLKSGETFDSLLNGKENISGKVRVSFQSKNLPETKGKIK